MRVAVLEDDISQLELMSHWVRMAGHSTHTFQHGEMLLRELVHESFDALLLDWNVPDISGIEVLRRVRRESTVPVLFCTGRGDESDVVTALHEGADDYLIKPVRRLELLARLQAVKRHSQTLAQDAIEMGAIRVNCQARTILRNGVPLEISIKDFDLSVLLLRNVGRLLSRREIRDAVWGSQLSLHSRTLDTHVSRVRTGPGLIPEHGWRLTAVYGHGYRLERCNSELLSAA
jgi:two-component system, OmpR family, response regulator RegX3